MKFAAVLLTLGVFTTPVLAFEIEEIGEIQATFGDEKIVQPTVIAKTDAQTSATAFMNVLGGGFSAISVTGFAPDNTRLYFGATFQTEAPGPDTAPFQSDIQFKTPEDDGYWTSDGAPTPSSIAFTTLEHDGKEGLAVGRFSGALCYAPGYDSDVDVDNCRPIEGSFDTKFFVE